MNWSDLREAIKWSLLVAILVACWYGVLAVRKSRAVESESRILAPTLSPQVKKQLPDTGLKPVWVIVVFEVQTRKIVGITEFVFPSYEECLAGAAQVRERFDLAIRPVCYLRWLETLPGQPA